MSIKLEKDGIIIFGLEGTLLTPSAPPDWSTFSRVEHGLELLKSAAEVNHFAVIISNAGESMRDQLVKLIEMHSGMSNDSDFGLFLIPESNGKPITSPFEHFKKVTSTWVDVCAKQNSRVTAGVSSEGSFLGIFEKFEIRTCKCDAEGTEVQRFIKYEHSEELPEDREYDGSDDPVSVLDTIESSEPSPDWQSDKIFDGDPAIEQAIQFPKYWKRIPEKWEFIDVYRTDELFPIDTLPGASRLYHARKKLMVPGVRTGGKSAYKDIQEAVATLQGWLRDHAPRSDA